MVTAGWLHTLNGALLAFIICGSIALLVSPRDWHRHARRRPQKKGKVDPRKHLPPST